MEGLYIICFTLLLVLVSSTTAQNAHIQSPKIATGKYGGGGLTPDNIAPAPVDKPPVNAPETNKKAGRQCDLCEKRTDCLTKLCVHKLCVNRPQQILDCKPNAKINKKVKPLLKCTKCSYSKTCKRGKCLKGRCARDGNSRRRCGRPGSREKPDKRKVGNRNAGKCDSCSDSGECQDGLRCVRRRCAVGWWSRWGCHGFTKVQSAGPWQPPSSYHQVPDEASDEVAEYGGYTNAAESNTKSDGGSKADCETCSKGSECASGQCIRNKCVSRKQYLKCLRNVRSSQETTKGDVELTHGDVVVDDSEKGRNDFMYDEYDDEKELTNTVAIELTSDTDAEEISFDHPNDDDEDEVIDQQLAASFAV